MEHTHCKKSTLSLLSSDASYHFSGEGGNYVLKYLCFHHILTSLGLCISKYPPPPSFPSLQ